MNSILAGLILLAAFIVGCSPASTPPSEITRDSFKDNVIALYGEPDRAQELVLSSDPFFVPQEKLINLVPAGTVIDEWVCEVGEEESYIWFTGDEDTREDWLVLDLGRYPKGAVY